MDHEMNFFDLCAAGCRAIGRGCAAIGRLFARMLRLTFRYWWIVLTLVALAIAAALYYTRHDNLTFRVNAIALLNGPSVQQFEQAYAPLRTGQMLPPDSPLQQWLAKRKVRNFNTYRVIDCYRDSVADYVDFKNKSVPTDTINAQMQDRLCLEFCIKMRDMGMLPAVETEVLQFLNSNPALQRSYVAWLPNLQEEIRFNHTQALKLDSLTSEYYFHDKIGDQPLTDIRNGMVWVGDRRIHLFLDKIYKHYRRVELMDYRLQLATAPVVLENHFAVSSAPVNGRKKCLVIFFLLGWIGGCVLAEIIDRRKQIIAWLKK